LRSFYLVVTLMLFLIFQGALANRIAIGSVQPDFLVLAVVFFALHRGPVRGALGGFVVGLLQDMANPTMLGINALVKSLLGYFVGRWATKAFLDSQLFLFGFFSFVAFAHDAIYLLFFQWPDVGAAIRLTFTVALPSAVYTGLVGVIMHRLLAAVGTKVVSGVGQAGH